MEADRGNFAEAWLSVKKALEDEKCLFVSFDLEFSGLDSSTTRNRSFPFDPPWRRYQELRKRTKDFTTLQLGLCVFSRSENGTLSARPYSFRCFPQKISRWLNKSVLFQVGSIGFLSSQNFDFNASLKKGIGSLSCIEESNMRTEFQEKLSRIEKSEAAAAAASVQCASPGPRSPPSRAQATRARDIEWIQDARTQCKNLTQKFQQAAGKGDISTNSSEEHSEDQKAPSVLLQPKNGFHRKLVYDLLSYEFPILTATKVSEMTGIRALLELLHKSGKPLVGHNMFTDLLRIINDFVIPCPPEYHHFKDVVSRMFPTIFDTRFIVTSAKLPYHTFIPEAHLAGAYETLKGIDEAACKQVKKEEDKEGDAKSKTTLLVPEVFKSAPKIRIDPDFALVVQEHDASFDAYMTGYIFAKAAYKWNSDAKTLAPSTPALWKYAKGRIPLFNSFTHLSIYGLEPYQQVRKTCEKKGCFRSTHTERKNIGDCHSLYLLNAAGFRECLLLLPAYALVAIPGCEDLAPQRAQKPGDEPCPTPMQSSWGKSKSAMESESNDNSDSNRRSEKSIDIQLFHLPNGYNSNPREFLVRIGLREAEKANGDEDRGAQRRTVAAPLVLTDNEKSKFVSAVRAGVKPPQWGASWDFLRSAAAVADDVAVSPPGRMASCTTKSTPLQKESISRKRRRSDQT
eukprot:jgi/Bigna1/126963/aug1.3_g1671